MPYSDHFKTLQIAPSKIAQYFFDSCKRRFLYSMSYVGQRRWAYVTFVDDVQEQLKVVELPMNEQMAFDFAILEDKDTLVLGDKTFDVNRHTVSIDGETFPMLCLKDVLPDTITIASKTVPVPNDIVEEEAPVTIKDKIFEKGDLWEEELLDIISKKGFTILHDEIDTARVSETKIEYEDFIVLLKDLISKENLKFPLYIYQPSFDVPGLVYERLGVDKEKVEFSTCYPDFLEVVKENDQFHIRVIDAKASVDVSPTHYVQITMYNIILQGILEEETLTEHFKILEESGVWLHKRDSYNIINTKYCSTMLTDFFKKTTLFNTRDGVQIREAPYYLTFKCSGCEYKSHCTEEAERTRNITMIKNVSQSDIQMFKNTFQAYTKDVVDIEDAYELLKDKEASLLREEDPSLEGKLARLSIQNDYGTPPSSPITSSYPSTPNTPTSNYRNLESPSTPNSQSTDMYEVPPTPSDYVSAEETRTLQDIPLDVNLLELKNNIESYRTGHVLVKNVPANITGKEDVALFIGWMRDVNYEPTMWYIGFRCKDRNKVRTTMFDINDDNTAFVIESTKSGASILSTFIDTLYNTLKDLEKTKLKVSLFVLQGADKYITQDVLFKMSQCQIKQYEERAKALYLTLFNEVHEGFHYYPDLMKGKLPIFILLKHVHKALYMPLRFDYTSYDVYKALCPEGKIEKGNEEIYDIWNENQFERNFGMALEILDAFRKRMYRQFEEVEGDRDLAFRKVATSVTFREEALFSQHHILDKMIHFSELNFYWKCKYLRDDRAKMFHPSLPYIPEDVTVLKLSHSDSKNYIFKILKISERTYSKSAAMFNLLVRMDHGAMRQALKYNEFKKRMIRQYYEPNAIVVQDKDVEIPDWDNLLLRKAKRQLREGDIYFLVPIEFSYTADQVKKALSNIPLQSQCVEFVTDPIKWGNVNPLDEDPKLGKEIQLSANNIEDVGICLTSEQMKVFQGIMKKRLQWILGPPGSGKTHFISTSISMLSETYKRLDRPLNILILCFTHSAIDNVVLKIKDIETKRMDERDRIAIIRLGGKKSQLKGGVWPDLNVKQEYIPSKTDPILVSGTSFDQRIVASTTWTLYKIPPKDHQFDMLIIDEASQMLLKDVLPALNYLKPNGRLVLVGDFNQLAPVLSLELDQEDSRHYGSILDFCRFSDPERICGGFLNENWRMNNTLVHVPASLIYSFQGMKYHSANGEIGNQRYLLNLIDDYLESSKLKVRIHNPLLRDCLDGLKPLVVVQLKDSMARNRIVPHSEIISAIANIMRTVSKVHYNEEEDETFWNTRLLVAAPHHNQKARIRETISDKSSKWYYPWNVENDSNILTIEKAQGREYDCVLADYAIFDELVVKREARFLFTLNRINVSFTRAKKKLIIFVSDTLLQLTSEILSSFELQRGAAYLHEYVKYAKSMDSFHEIDVEDLDSIVSQLKEEDYQQFYDIKS